MTRDCKARRPGELWNQSAGGAELDDEYSAFLDDLGISKKKAKQTEEKPYVPPMGSADSRAGSSFSKPAPRLMLTNGSAAPGAAIAAARKSSTTAKAKNAFSHLEQRGSMFGGRLAAVHTLGTKPDNYKGDEKKKVAENYVPTHWIAEQSDRHQV